MVIRTSCAVVLAALVSWQAYAAELTGRVQDVLDGDTISLVGVPDKIRLAEIDAPEIAHKRGDKDQPHGHEARRALKEMIDRKDVRVVWLTKDRYGRYIGTVYLGENDVNAEMVRQGHAWVYDQYVSGSRKEFLGLLEQQAHLAGKGLWSLSYGKPVEPWLWRKGKKEPAANDNDDDQYPEPAPKPSPSPYDPAQGPACGTKMFCSQMASCDEARAFLTMCQGMKGLDKDGDGVPCEDKCR